jgi:excinuclease ABC subunit A
MAFDFYRDDGGHSHFEALPSIRDKMIDGSSRRGTWIHPYRATTLSWEEEQLIKFSKELTCRSTGKTLFVTPTGLHFVDEGKLLQVLQHLVDQGNTVTCDRTQP